jgi:hypothetical protein
VAAFVAWHLFFLVFRNPLDLWREPILDWCKGRGWWPSAEAPFEQADAATSRYGNLCGVPQGWRMFTAPLARSAPFLAARIEFTDGSREELRSLNEPDPRSFVRLGGWRLRKLEDHLSDGRPETLPGNRERELWGAYVRWCVRRWRAGHPGDPRTPARVVLVRRQVTFPAPGDPPGSNGEPEYHAVGTFLPDGRLP